MLLTYIVFSLYCMWYNAVSLVMVLVQRHISYYVTDVGVCAKILLLIGADMVMKFWAS